MKWYYAESGVQRGPVEDEEFKTLTASGTIQPDTLVWRDGMANWVRWDSLSGPPPITEAAPVTSALPPDGARFCSSCGKPYAAAALVPIGDHIICANCKPAFLQSMREGRQSISAQHYGGFWIRFAARIIDGILVGVVSTAIQFFVGAALGISLSSLGGGDREGGAVLAILGLVYLIGIAINLAYEVYFLVNRGATPGKMMLNLKVTRSDGGPISTGRAAGRFFGYLLSTMTAAIGFIIAAFDDQKRSLHDHLCDTRVIRTD